MVRREVRMKTNTHRPPGDAFLLLNWILYYFFFFKALHVFHPLFQVGLEEARRILWSPRVHLCPSETGLFPLSDLGSQDAGRSEGAGPLRLTRCHARESAPGRQTGGQRTRLLLAASSLPARDSAKEGGGWRRESGARRRVPGNQGCADVTGRAIRAGAL